jgi:hypothetical protein
LKIADIKMLALLRELISRNPFVEEIDFSDSELYCVDSTSVELLGRFTELKKVSREMWVESAVWLGRFVRQSDQEDADGFKRAFVDYRAEY